MFVDSLAPIALELERRRRQQKIPQFDIAAKLGVSQSQVSLFARGTLPSHLTLIERYAEIVGADIPSIHQELLSALPAMRAARHPLAFDVERLPRETGEVCIR